MTTIERAAPDRDALLAAIATLARNELGHHGKIEPSTRLVEDLGLDSLRLLTLATAVEDHFRVCFDETDEAALVTVADLVAVVAAKGGQPGGR